ncbi:MAG: hypothetical protein HY851_08735 [candidate division Zixibacteria bacterium]|nr:hypothetical protein [candidate division Zixibacteria bacterium]
MPIPEPAVSRRTLTLTAAALWTLAGLVLITRALFWLNQAETGTLIMAALFAVIGLLKGEYILSRIARRNVQRIRELSPHKSKICIFAFQAMQSYLIVTAMITAGILLRLSPLPRHWLAMLYIAIGVALEWASVVYWKTGFSRI